MGDYLVEPRNRVYRVELFPNSARGNPAWPRPTIRVGHPVTTNMESYCGLFHIVYIVLKFLSASNVDQRRYVLLFFSLTDL